MTTLQFADTHNLVAFLSKPAESEGFEQIVDFLNANPIRYALRINPNIYTSCIEQFWATAKVKTDNGEVHYKPIGWEKISEGSEMPTNPHHIPTIIQPSTSQPQKKQRSKRPKRKDTQVPQPSGPTTNVVDEVVNELMDDSWRGLCHYYFLLEAERQWRMHLNREKLMTDKECRDTLVDETQWSVDDDTLAQALAALKRNIGIKRLHDDLEVNVAKLMLLVYKLLLL
ncbi:hypothetical protein Tco_0988598, partial [Tanacetum coccineum]